MKPCTGQTDPPSAWIGAYHTRTSLQSLAEETSITLTLSSIWPRRPLIGLQLAWRIRIVRSSMIRLTAATWPRSELPCGRSAITAPTLGQKPRA